ncbi:type II toxin-antitoxin system PemK/MazF family toxin [Clostridium sp. FP2]|uniref:type II toxin-antitoxin system PemK/MazF family toxin n=1 Tax=Clostridium sp. FP2 TaxID=2724481 RepID=UPI0013E8F6F1|nr:type II toxin-antitoxin system PemK/MazF family toxin [Clostridium sp. FP2]MBZ9622891.1 type II toxin-antitoxin system PemK/MazF family toxin [Clostridium sp. FP2]
MEKVIVRRSDIFEVQLKGEGNLLHGKHPVLVLSCQVSNKFSDLINVVPLTSTTNKDNPSNVLIGTECGLKWESAILTNQVQTISKSNILFKIGFVNLQKMQEVERVLMNQLGIKNNWGDLKLYQIYEKNRMEIRMAKCQEDYELLRQLSEKYLKNLYEMGRVIQGTEIHAELEWANFHLALALKKNGQIYEAYDVAKKSLTFSTTINSEYIYTCWMVGSLCIELGDDFVLEGCEMFEKCITFYDQIKEERYKILSQFNKAKILKRVPEMQACIKSYKDTRFKPMLCSFSDMEKSEVILELQKELDDIKKLVA